MFLQYLNLSELYVFICITEPKTAFCLVSGDLYIKYEIK